MSRAYRKFSLLEHREEHVANFFFAREVYLQRRSPDRLFKLSVYIKKKIVSDTMMRIN